MKAKIIGTMLIFSIESLLQVLYYTIAIKYFDNFQSFDSLYDVLKDTLLAVGSVKLVFFLPVYLIFYLWILSNIKRDYIAAIFHAGVFLIVFLVLGSLLPGELLKRYIDIIFTTLISFSVAYLYIHFTEFGNAYAKRQA